MKRLRLYRLLGYLWELPQNLVSLLILNITRSVYVTEYQGSIVYGSYKLNPSNKVMSLGNYIIYNFDEYTLFEVKNNIEINDARQESKLLGPLYLLLGYVPNLIWRKYGNLFKRVWNRIKINKK